MINYALKNEIEEFYDTIYEYENIILKIPGKIIDFRPNNDCWTIREHITHTADKELSKYYDFLLSTTPKPELDLNKLLADRKYDMNNIYNILDQIRHTRTSLYKQLRWIPQDKWESIIISNSTMNIESLFSWLNSFSNHSKKHMEYIKRNIKEWKNKDLYNEALA